MVTAGLAASPRATLAIGRDVALERVVSLTRAHQPHALLRTRDILDR